jgi:UDP-glucose 4-epimerase
MRVLVTGATGFVGSHVCQALLAENHEVLALSHSRGNDLIAPLLNQGSFHLLNGDIRSLPNTQNIMEANKVDAVIHLAARKVYPSTLDMYPEYVEANAKGTINVIHSALLAKVPRVIFSSTKDVYGVPKYLPVDEDHPVKPLAFYDLTKSHAEQCCEYYAQHYDISVIVLRFACLYGIGRKRGVTYNFIQAALKGQPFPISSDGNQTRDFVYVGDVASATVKALGVSGETKFDVFNIGTGRETSVNELAAKINDITAANIDFQYVPKDSDERFVFDIGKAQRVLGYQPRPLDDTLNEFVQSLKSGGKT